MGFFRAIVVACVCVDEWVVLLMSSNLRVDEVYDIVDLSVCLSR